MFKRAETLLVQAYAASLSEGIQAGKIRCTAGVTDMCVSDGISHDLVEAKSGATHLDIRQALGQILDYAYAVAAPTSNGEAPMFPA